MIETVGSLRAYFVVVGILGLIGNIPAVIESSSPKLLIIGLIGLGLSIAYLYIGVRLQTFLKQSPKSINNVILARVIFGIFDFLLTSLISFEVSSLIGLVIILLINWYLFINIKRLSQ